MAFVPSQTGKAQKRPPRVPPSVAAGVDGTVQRGQMVPHPAVEKSDQRGEACRKRVPQREDRRRIVACAAEVAERLELGARIGRQRIESEARAILAKLGLAEVFLGWTMVAVGSAMWRGQVTAVPYDRRLMLLPHCMRDPDRCPAEMNEVGLQCVACGACPLADLKARAERLGYRILIAEGSPIVMQLILAGQADAVLGVGCLDSLEKSLEKLLMAGVPGMAVPLFGCDCKNSRTDLDSVVGMIETPHVRHATASRGRVELLRAAHRLFQPEELFRLAAPSRGVSWETLRQTATSEEAAVDATVDLSEVEPIVATELLAYEFLLRGGKHFRPFITLAAYEALATDRSDANATLPDAVKRIAIAIEVFHKASLVHDDIEDDDAFRYGRPTLHRSHGAATAINVGDYLIGLGYRLAASQCGELPAEVVTDIVARLAAAHTRLSEGQGAELAWRSTAKKPIAPIDALKIYALKTAPAFEVALYAGLRAAGPVAELDAPLQRFSRQLGVAFQILNDLDDWKPDAKNKRACGIDVLRGRPTVLLALALERLSAPDRAELLRIVSEPGQIGPDEHERVAALYDRASVRPTADALVARHAARAREVADSMAPARLAELLHYFVDTIIGR